MIDDTPGSPLAVGVVPPADIPQFDFWATIPSQYANSPQLTSLIESWAQSLDMVPNFQNFYADIWDWNTATGYGLDVWGRIVGVERTITIEGQPVFGFKESTTAVGFGQGMFYTGPSITPNFVLGDETFLNLIKGKALANISDSSIPSINNVLMTLFPGRGNAWVTDTSAFPTFFGFTESTTAFGFGQSPFYSGASVLLSLTYNFTFPLTPTDIGIINSGVIPKPTGVQADIAEVF